MFLTVGAFIQETIDKMNKTIDKKSPNQNQVRSINNANEGAANLVQLANTRYEEMFSSLEEMQTHMTSQIENQVENTYGKKNHCNSNKDNEYVEDK